MSKRIAVENRKKGNLKVGKRVGISKGGHATYKVVCKCGEEYTTTGVNIRRNAKGCKRCFAKTHLWVHYNLHNRWKRLKYVEGKRGLVCEEWRESFDKFLQDIKKHYLQASMESWVLTRYSKLKPWQLDNVYWKDSKQEERIDVHEKY